MKKLLIILTIFCTWPAVAQQRDSRVREYLSPVRIVWQQHSELIRIRHTKGTDGQVKSEVNAPEGVQVYLEE